MDLWRFGLPLISRTSEMEGAPAHGQSPISGSDLRHTFWGKGRKSTVIAENSFPSRLPIERAEDYM